MDRVESAKSLESNTSSSDTNLNFVSSSSHREISSVLEASFFLLCVLSVLACLGCGGNANGPFALSGTVMMDDQPLEKGSITFDSVGGDSKSTTGGAISNGEYSIEAKNGVVAGTYRVSISAADTSNATSAGLPPNGKYFPSLISPEFNKAKHQIEVTAAGPNEFPFNVKHAK